MEPSSARGVGEFARRRCAAGLIRVGSFRHGRNELDKDDFGLGTGFESRNVGRKNFVAFALGGVGYFDWSALRRARVWSVGWNELVNRHERGQSRGYGLCLLGP